MEIREELPPPEEPKKPVAMKVVEKLERHDKGKEPVGKKLPESVQRARDMDTKKPATQADKDIMALFDQLEDEEDEELGVDRQKNEGEGDGDGDDDDEEVDDYDSDQFDSDIADSMADLTYAGYDDDEEYSTQGIVEHVDEAEEDPASQIPHVVAHEEDQTRTPVEPAPKIAPRRVPPPMPANPVVIEKPNARKPKVSRFKAAREKERMSQQPDAVPSSSSASTSADVVVNQPIKSTPRTDSADEEKPAMKDRKAVSWGTVNTVSEHDRTAAPSAVAQAASYTEPMKEPTETAEIGGRIRSPADIFNLMMQQPPLDAEDDYPSLDAFDEAHASSEPIDLNELARSARIIPQELWHAQRDPEGAIAVAPLIQEMMNAQNRLADDGDEEEDEVEEQEERNHTPSKLDTRIMRGAVMERDIEPVDVEKVEEDMDLREVSSSIRPLTKRR